MLARLFRCDSRFAFNPAASTAQLERLARRLAGVDHRAVVAEDGVQRRVRLALLRLDHVSWRDDSLDKLPRRSLIDGFRNGDL